MSKTEDPVPGNAFAPKDQSGGGRAGSVLSYGQEHLWLTYLLEPDSPWYNTPVCLRLRGKVSVSAIEQSITELLGRHEALRTVFVVEEGYPRQRFVPALPWKLAVNDLSDDPVAERESRAMDSVYTEASRAMEIQKEGVFRASLVKMSEEDYILVMVVHHIAFDGWSRDVLLRDFRTLYESFSTGKEPALSPIPATYRDYVSWQRSSVRSAAWNEHLQFWRAQLGDSPAGLTLPTDFPPPTVRTSRGDFVRFTMEPHLKERLAGIQKSENATLFMVLLAAYVVQLHRYSDQENIFVGTPVAGRVRPETENMIGYFISTLPLRVSVAGDPTFRELVRRVRSAVIAAISHQEIPLEGLLDELQLPHGFGRNPLFRVVFAIDRREISTWEVSGVRMELIEVVPKTSKFDLMLSLKDGEDSLSGEIEFSTELFQLETIRRMVGHFQRVVEGLMHIPDRHVSELEILTEREQHEIFREWNATDRKYPRDRCIHELFEEQVREDAGRPALVCGGQKLTYGELNRRANLLAHRLRNQGVGREMVIGLCADRSVEMVLGMLGILKAGGAYLPLDPEYPQERVRYMLEDGGVQLVVCSARCSQKVALPGIRQVPVDIDVQEAGDGNDLDPPNLVTPENLAYVMHTSGSTGAPKGVCIVHRGVVRLVKGNTYASLGPDEVILQLAPFSFDASTFEIWGTLLNGGRLVLGPPGLPAYDEIGRLIRDHHVSTLWLTAGLFHAIVDAGLDALAGLRQLLVGGDVVSPTHAARFKTRYPQTRLINGYGPTENTTFTCCYEISGKEAGPLPIGRPIANTSVWILDKHLRPVPVGVTGELCIGGDGLARGYLNDTKLTDEKFVPNLLGNGGSAVLYRSGDMATYRADGVIMFEGRQDNQVKISGYRIETEEVESGLRTHPGLAQAFVQARPFAGGEKRLVAYCVARPGAQVTPSLVLSHMRERLPEYMVPSAIVFLPELPLNAQGKVDRHALPEPELREIQDGEPHMPPRDPLEMLLASIWKKLFDIGSVGIRDNFFELGGHSLLAFRAFAELEKATGVRLPLATLFEAPTIEQIAGILREKGWKPAWSALVPIKPAGSRPPMYFIHGVGGNVLNFYDLARCLHPDQPVFGLQSIGLDGKEAPLVRIEDMARRYIDEIKMLQPGGPYFLGGMSFGGMVAFEMASQLMERGEAVALLALLDTSVVMEYPLNMTIVRKRLLSLSRRFRYHLRNLFTLPPKDKLDHIRKTSKTVKRKFRSRLWQLTHDINRPVAGSISVAQRAVKESNFVAARRYRARPYSGKVTLFVAAERTIEIVDDPVEQWKPLAKGGVDVITIPGDHLTIVTEPNVRVLAQRLDEYLARANHE